LGAKQFETRSWRSWYTGPVLIHASKSYPGWAKAYEKEEPFYSALRPRGCYAYPELACGHIIGRAEIVQCFRTELIRGPLSETEIAFGDYSDGRFAWKLANASFLPKPILAKGALGLWVFDYPPTSTPIEGRDPIRAISGDAS